MSDPRTLVLQQVRALNENFTFEELRARLALDYETLRDVIFELLQQQGSGLIQEFDTKSKCMRFRRTAG